MRNDLVCYLRTYGSRMNFKIKIADRDIFHLSLLIFNL